MADELLMEICSGRMSDSSGVVLSGFGGFDFDVQIGKPVFQRIRDFQGITTPLITQGVGFSVRMKNLVVFKKKAIPDVSAVLHGLSDWRRPASAGETCEPTSPRCSSRNRFTSPLWPMYWTGADEKHRPQGYFDTCQLPKDADLPESVR